MADEQALPHLMLGDVYDEPNAIDFLWLLLKARDGDGKVNISHRSMPALEEHVAFVQSRPYKEWRIVYLSNVIEDRPIGAVYLSRQDEIGVHILPPFRRKGYGEWAVRAMMAIHPEVKRFLANINPRNSASIALFRNLGFFDFQITLQQTSESAAWWKEGKCPQCGAELETGYGLAGGGMGVYFYCTTHGIVSKHQDPEMQNASDVRGP